STRPRGARPDQRPHCGQEVIVSIHAPAWGATADRCSGSLSRYVSIHAPAWGATPGTGKATGLELLFQSTRPRGARRCEGWWCKCLTLFQSTDRKSTRLNSSHVKISYAVFCLKKKKKHN